MTHKLQIVPLAQKVNEVKTTNHSVSYFVARERAGATTQFIVIQLACVAFVDLQTAAEQRQ